MSGSGKRSRELRCRIPEFSVLSQSCCIKRIKEYIRASSMGGTFIVSKF